MSSSRAKGLMCTSSSSYVLQRVCTGLLSEYIILDFNFRSVLNIVFFILGDSTASEYYVPTFRNTLPHLHRRCEQEQTSSPQCVPKYHHIKFSRRGITQKKEYKTTENTSLPCNVSFCVCFFLACF